MWDWDIHLTKKNGDVVILNFCDKGECERMLEWYRKNEKKRFTKMEMVEVK